jgi:hypothetical protein
MSQALLKTAAADIESLPIFARVLLASRLARRATLWLAGGGHEAVRAGLIASCDAVERCALGGEAPAFNVPQLPYPPGILTFIVEACEEACAAARAAAAGDAARCSTHVHASLAASLESKGFNRLQGAIFLAGDLSQIIFACGEVRLGREQPLTRQVMERLIPVYPPDEVPPAHVEFDPTFGAR